MGGLVVTMSGLGLLLALAVSEVLRNPGWSIADGYWRGRLPWAPIGIDLVLVGATLAAGAGLVATWISGGPARRAVGVVGLLIVAVWWFVALLPPPVAVPCPSCPAPGPDPVAMAYSVPEQTMLLLVVPAATLALLALRSGRPRPASPPTPALPVV